MRSAGLSGEHYESIPRATLPAAYFEPVGEHPVEAFVFVAAGARPDQSLVEAGTGWHIKTYRLGERRGRGSANAII